MSHYYPTASSHLGSNMYSDTTALNRYHNTSYSNSGELTTNISTGDICALTSYSTHQRRQFESAIRRNNDCSRSTFSFKDVCNEDNDETLSKDSDDLNFDANVENIMKKYGLSTNMTRSGWESTPNDGHSKGPTRRSISVCDDDSVTKCVIEQKRQVGDTNMNKISSKVAKGQTPKRIVGFKAAGKAKPRGILKPSTNINNCLRVRGRENVERCTSHLKGEAEVEKKQMHPEQQEHHCDSSSRKTDLCYSSGTDKNSNKNGDKKKNKAPHDILNEAKRVHKENQLLKLEGVELRESLTGVRQGLMVECAKVLHSVISYCEDKSHAHNAKGKGLNTKPVTCPQSRLGAGCGCGGCGGYTPSGWNKAKVKQDMECPCPDRTASPCPPPCDNKESEPPAEGRGACESGVVDCNMRPSVRILGEMAFQLERRILEYVFGAEGKCKRRFYGYTVSNVCFMITKESTTPSGKSDVIGKSDKAERFEKIMCALQKYGYEIKCHPEFSQDIVNKYGVLPCPPDQSTIDVFRLQDPNAVSCLISKLCGSPSEVAGLNILLKCLSYLATCDGKPLFVW